MNYIIAKTDRQLGICLRMLFPEQKSFTPEPYLNDKGKMEYRIPVELDDDRYEYYRQTFETLIS